MDYVPCFRFYCSRFMSTCPRTSVCAKILKKEKASNWQKSINIHKYQRKVVKKDEIKWKSGKNVTEMRQAKGTNLFKSRL